RRREAGGVLRARGPHRGDARRRGRHRLLQWWHRRCDRARRERSRLAHGRALRRPRCSCAVGRTRGAAAARAADAGLMRTAAFFDLDGALLPGTSTERIFLRRAVATGAMSPVRLAWGGARAFFSFVTGRSATLFEHKAYLAAQDVRRLEALGVECVHAEVL